MRVHRHAPTITDTISFPFITEVAIAPGGEYVAYVVRTADWEKNKYVLTCFLHSIDRNDTQKIAEDTWHPRWLNDNTLAVLHRGTKDSERLEINRRYGSFTLRTPVVCQSRLYRVVLSSSGATATESSIIPIPIRVIALLSENSDTVLNPCWSRTANNTTFLHRFVQRW